MSSNRNRKYYILTPVYNDWDSLRHLLENIDFSLREIGDLAVIAVNDCSASSLTNSSISNMKFKTIKSFDVINLIYNMGHQKAIAIGLSHIAKNNDAEAVIVMDSDGEDKPEDAQRLILAHRTFPTDVIVAQRTRRSESFLFVLSYIIYKLIFRFMTGNWIDFGNFTLIPGCHLYRLSKLPDIWNNFPSGILKSRISITHLPTNRGKRYSGQSKMCFSSLVNHALTAITVFGSLIFSRLLILLGLVFCASLVSIIGVIALKLFTSLPIPGWTSNVVFILTILLLHSFVSIAIASFLTITMQLHLHTIPYTQYETYIDDISTII